VANFDGSTLFGGDERGYTDYPSGSQTDRTDEALSATNLA
jgi:N-ethylmaleimide reductase